MCNVTAPELRSAFYNGLALGIAGDVMDFNSTKTIRFSRVQGAYLALTALGSPGCGEDSFHILCSNGLSSADSWEVSSSTDLTHRQGGATSFREKSF